MESIHRALDIIRNQSKSDSAKVLRRLMDALKHDHPIRPSELDALGYDDCQLALQLILDWRVARHYFARL
jgi:hypothetical protein